MHDKAYYVSQPTQNKNKQQLIPHPHRQQPPAQERPQTYHLYYGNHGQPCTRVSRDGRPAALEVKACFRCRPHDPAIAALVGPSTVADPFHKGEDDQWPLRKPSVTSGYPTETINRVKVLASTGPAMPDTRPGYHGNHSSRPHSRPGISRSSAHSCHGYHGLLNGTRRPAQTAGT